jgi:predicted aspartyl protease
LAAASQSAFEVPFRLGDNAIILDAVVNGHALSLMFDSGFGGSVVANDNLNLGEADGTMNLRDFVGQYTAKTVRINSFTLGGHPIELSEPQAIEQPVAHLTAAFDTHTDGILGLQAIENYVTEINFEHQKIIFHPQTYDISTRAPDNTRTFMDRLLPLGANSLEMSASTSEGKKLHLALDTGNSFYATINRDVIERIGLWSPSQNPKYMSEAMIASGLVHNWNKKMDGMTIFGVNVPTSYWDVINLPSSDAEGDGTVGVEFLKNFNITVDYNRRKVWLENFTGKVANDPRGETGILAEGNKQTGQVDIVFLTPDGPAEKAGIEKSDKILEIDGVEASPNWTIRQLTAKLDGVPGTKIQLAISHGGFLKRYELVRQGLYN